MTIGLCGKKCGMTRAFLPDGRSLPITIVQIDNHRVVQVKTKEKDGYSAVQLTMGQKKSSKLNKPMAGHYAKANVAAGDLLWEVRVGEEEIAKYDLKVGTELTIDLFSDGQMVDVTGVTKGKGFAGVIKRYHFHTQDATHGNSLSHRAPGSIGQRQTPGRVMKGKKMAGHLGNVRRTIQNQEILRVDKEKGVLLIKGAVPGAPGGHVIVLPAVKQSGSKE